ncbi:MAG: HEAT repeat domain-containing protein [Chloroflexi bacterium]|nr:HEAT repeat domain-containing protein [Chloroflexota bacterium]
MRFFRRRPDVDRLAARGDVPGLARALTDDEPAVRQAAAAALVRCPPGPAAPALALALADPDPTVRAAAGEALGRLDAAPAVAALRAQWRATPDEAPLLLAALGRLAADGAAWATLVEAASAPDPVVRVAAARALGRRGDARSVAPLLAALADADAHVSASAVTALAAVGPERALAPLTVVLADGAPPARALAAEALGAMSDARALTPLARALADPDPAVRAAALAAIDRLPEPGRQIAAQASAALEPAARERAAQRLRQIAALPPLQGALAARDHPGLRAAAARAIARLGEPGIVAALAGALADPEPAVRQEAAWLLGVSGRPDALAPLLTALTGAADPALRATAARALGRLGQPAAAPALEAARADPDPAVATAAARALTTLTATPAGGQPTASDLLQIVIFQTDPGPDAEPADLTPMLDEIVPAALSGATDIQIVTMVPGQPLPSFDEALLIVRRQFRTAPPGYAWQPVTYTDAAGRACLVLLLRPTA